MSNLIPEDCFSQVTIDYYLDRITVVAQPGQQHICSDGYFQSIPYTYDRWFFSFGVSELKDASGFIFKQTFDY